jgi:Tfp pilus assembly protein PilV
MLLGISSAFIMMLLIVAIMAMAMTSAMAASSIMAAMAAAKAAASARRAADIVTMERSEPACDNKGTTTKHQSSGASTSHKSTRLTRSRLWQQQRQQKTPGKELAEWTAGLFSSRHAREREEEKRAAREREEWPEQRPDIRSLTTIQEEKQSL